MTGVIFDWDGVIIDSHDTHQALSFAGLADMILQSLEDVTVADLQALFSKID